MDHKVLPLALETKCYEVRTKKFTVLVYVHEIRIEIVKKYTMLY